MIALMARTLHSFLPDDQRLGRLVGVEQLGFFLLLKWLDEQEPGAFLAPINASFQWSAWISRPDLREPAALNRFVEEELLKHLRDCAAADPRKPLSPLFSQSHLLTCTFTARASVALQWISEQCLSQPEVRQAWANLLLDALDQTVKPDATGGHAVPESLCRLLVQLAGVKASAVVYDPACASAGFLGSTVASLPDGEGVWLNTYAETTKPWVLLCNVIAILQAGLPIHWRVRPEFRQRWLPENATVSPGFEADLVVMNPPYGFARTPDGGRTKTDAVESVRLEGLFLERGLAALKPDGGKLAVILPDGFLSGQDRGAVSLRRRLVEEYHLRFVISLPVGLFRGSSAKTSLLFLQHTHEPTGQVLYCEMPASSVRDTALSEGWCQAATALIGTWIDGAPPTADDGMVNWWTVGMDTFRANGYSLAPHNPCPPGMEVRPEPLSRIVQRLLVSVHDFEQSLRCLQQALETNEEESA